MIDKLTLTYNRTRQAVITGELIEIISGAAAVQREQYLFKFCFIEFFGNTATRSFTGKDTVLSLVTIDYGVNFG